jgi:hypothetical protein
VTFVVPSSLTWPGLDHPVVVTTSLDATARVWDPQRPDTELAHPPLFGQGFFVLVLDGTTVAVSISRGFLVVELLADATPQLQ